VIFMKNVTVAIDDELHRKARIRAAELGTSLSALVKDYLESIAVVPAAEPAVAPAGVREMSLNYRMAPVEAPPAGPPYLVDGEWVWTKGGKPRQPGALRGMLTLSEEGSEWPDGFIEAMYGEDTDKPWYK
jgi:plasmid stability protein